MKGSFGLLFYALITGGGSAFQIWDSLRVSWCYEPSLDPEHCFQKIPRTVNEAYSAGWHELSRRQDCVNQGKFNGRRFLKGRDLAISPLFDVNGIIAGIQMNLVKEELLANGTNPYKFAEVGDYLDNYIAGKPAYSLTFYFVDPARICHGGRTEADLIQEGTGTALYIQTGPTPHNRNLMGVPLYRDVAIQHGWTENECVPTMGHHNYYRVEKMSDSQCTKIRPSFLLFNNNGELLGWGGTAVGAMSSKSFEHPGPAAFKSGLGAKVPQCMLDLSEGPGYSNMHMFFIDQPRSIQCKTLVQSPHSNSNIYVNPRAVSRRPRPSRNKEKSKSDLSLRYFNLNIY